MLTGRSDVDYDNDTMIWHPGGTHGGDAKDNDDDDDDDGDDDDDDNDNDNDWMTMAHTSRWCSRGDAKEEVGPGKQAVLCQGRTAHEVGACSSSHNL